MRIAVPTNPAFTPDMRLILSLDADDDRQTGLTGRVLQGIDYVMYVDPLTYQDDSAHLLGCVGGANVCIYEQLPPYSYSGGATVTLPASSLGLSRIERVRFSVNVGAGVALAPGGGFDFTSYRVDRAPDEEFWTFDARPLRVVALRATPSTPRAGKAFALAMRLSPEGVASPETTKVSCSLTIGGKPVRARTRGLTARQARCVFDVPAGTSGRGYRASIRVTARGTSLERAISGRVP